MMMMMMMMMVTMVKRRRMSLYMVTLATMEVWSQTLRRGTPGILQGVKWPLIKGRKGEDCGWATKEAGEPPRKRILLSATARITVRSVYTVLASLRWDRREELASYIVQVLEDERE